MRRIFCAVVLILLLSLLCGAVAGQDVVDSGSCGSNLTWELTADGTLTIRGTGQMYGDWENDLRIRRVILEPGVTNLSSHAFCGCSKLEEIVLPDSVTSIGPNAFAECTSLTAIELPSGITKIDVSVFRECSALQTVMLPEGLAEIGDSAFYACSSLKSLMLPEGLETLEGSAFSYCSALEQIDLPDGITVLQNYTFSNCTKLQQVTLPSQLTMIEAKAFSSCSALTEIALPDRLQQIGEGAFSGCNSLTHINLPQGLERIEQSTFYGCERLRQVELPSGLKVIENQAFSDCAQITELTLPETLQEIGAYAFSRCSSLAHINLPQNIETLHEGVFQDCKTLQQVHLPSGVKSIEADVFSGCTSLKTIELPQALEQLSMNAFQNCSNLQSLVIPSGTQSTGTVNFNSCSSLKTLSIPEGITTIPSYAFSGCENLQQLDLPDGITAVGENAFQSCQQLSRIVLPQSIRSIGASAFQGCNSLQTITLPEGLTSLGKYAFSNCSALERITLPGSLSTLSAEAFCYCSSLVEVILSEGLQEIEQNAFAYCGSLETITFPASLKKISQNAFSDCYALAKVEFLGDAPEVEENVFPASGTGGFTIFYHSGTAGWLSPYWNGYAAVCIDPSYSDGDFSLLNEENRNVQNLLFTLNESAGTAVVGDNTYNYNNAGYLGDNNGHVVLPATVTKNGKTYRVIGIGRNAFARNTKLREITLGAYLSSVDYTAFSGCTELAWITVEGDNAQFRSFDGVLYDYTQYQLYLYPPAREGSSYALPRISKKVAPYAFQGAQKLNLITVPNGVTSIGTGAFYGCTNLQKLIIPFAGTSATTGIMRDIVDVNGRGKLESLVITGGQLRAQAFYGLSTLRNLELPIPTEEIPDRCFYGCSSLRQIVFTGDDFPSKDGEIQIPDGITRIGSQAFSDCAALTQVHIPASVTTIGDGAFAYCTGMEAFFVDADNPSYESDAWNVLFTKGKETLLYYPSARPWPYYNVPEETRQINELAFYGCDPLVNLYLPDSISSISTRGIASTSLTVCAYYQSYAARYAEENNLNLWYLDNYELQGIVFEKLPEQQVFAVGTEDFSGLYVAADYGGVRLQADDYVVSYDPAQSGVQQVTVTYQGKSASFPILLYDAAQEYLVDFGALTLPNGTLALAAAYDGAGRQLMCQEITVLEGKAQMVVPKTIYAAMAEAKLFCVNEVSYVPVEKEISLQLSRS